jgi:RNA polymerase sigma-70 factor (ECF subfamily)
MKEQLKYLPLGTVAEKELLTGLRRGEPASYRHLYDRFAPRLRRILQRIFSDSQLARDAVQATFLIVFQKIDRFDGRSSLLTWLTRVAINEAHALRRKDSRRPLAPLASEEHPRTPEQVHGDREYQRQLSALLSALSEEKRVALLLFEVEGFSVQEIADIMGEPRGTLLARLARTRAELQKELRCWSGEDASATGSKVRGRDHG